jgi:hypothetical protein
MYNRASLFQCRRRSTGKRGSTLDHQGCQIFLWTWYQNRKKCTKWTKKCAKCSYNIPKVHETFQMAIKYVNIFEYKALQNLPKIGILGLKSNHLSTLLTTPIKQRPVLTSPLGAKFVPQDWSRPQGWTLFPRGEVTPQGLRPSVRPFVLLNIM